MSLAIVFSFLNKSLNTSTIFCLSMTLDYLSMILTVFGLCLFETVSSLDNAFINAEVLHTMSQRARRWFLLWGILFAVFIIRGILPLIIIWWTTPSLGFIGAFTATFSSNPAAIEAIEASAPILLAGGGIFLVFLFFHWLFMEPKVYGLHAERFFERQAVWFYAVVSILLALVTWFALKKHPLMAFSAVIDATFSIDGVLGAFAFTLAIPLILIGNGLGAIVVRQVTVGNIERVKKYKLLKNGAMYSIFVLGSIMLAESFGLHIPSFITPIVTMGILGYFFWRSKKELEKNPSSTSA